MNAMPAEQVVVLPHEHGGDDAEREAGQRDRVRRQARLDQPVAHQRLVVAGRELIATAKASRRRGTRSAARGEVGGEDRPLALPSLPARACRRRCGARSATAARRGAAATPSTCARRGGPRRACATTAAMFSPTQSRGPCSGARGSAIGVPSLDAWPRKSRAQHVARVVARRAGERAAGPQPPQPVAGADPVDEPDDLALGPVERRRSWPTARAGCQASTAQQQIDGTASKQRCTHSDTSDGSPLSARPGAAPPASEPEPRRLRAIPRGADT